MHDVYERVSEPYLLEEAAPNEHPLAAMFSIPRLALDLMAKGDWATAVEVATRVGVRDTTMLTNLVFWFRHPGLTGQRIRADQPELAREWLRIRDEIVRPVLAGRPRTSPPGPPPAKRTAIPSSGLRWFGPPDEKTPELMAFMRKVYDLQVTRSKGDFVDTLPEEALDTVEGQPARKDAAAKARTMFAAARAALAAEGLTRTVRIGVLSGYRSADRQFDIWQGRTTKGRGGFPHYYEQTKQARRHPRFGGEHSDKAAAYLAGVMAKLVAAPGYSNHQDGLALDLGTRKGKGGLIKLYKGSWFHNWLTDNARLYQFEPLPTEAWHWTYRPKSGELESETRAAAPAVRANKISIAKIDLLAEHVGEGPHLVLGWNDMRTVPAELDVVVHLHGYSRMGMTLPRDIEEYSGLDLRTLTRPTLTVLPRGNFTGIQKGKDLYKYDFPKLVVEGGLSVLVKVALDHFARFVGMPMPKRARLILTAHSGGGPALMDILARSDGKNFLDPDEVHVYDGLYGSATALVKWAQRHIMQDLAARAIRRSRTSAMRVFFIPASGTCQSSLRLHRAIEGLLPKPPAAIRNRYRVESARQSHMQIPKKYGPRILADAAAHVPGAARPTPDDDRTCEKWVREHSPKNKAFPPRR